MHYSHFRHEAFFYAAHDEFMEGILGFIRDAVATDEPILVMLSSTKIDALRPELAIELRDPSATVVFADMAKLGANPARIIPAWQDFVAHYSGGGGRVRGIGEPIWAARSPAALAECKRHEALLNAPSDGPDGWTLCPYDTAGLEEAVLAAAMRNHPYIRTGDVSTVSARFLGIDALIAPFDEPLSQAPTQARVLKFHRENLREVRAFVADIARGAKMREERVTDLSLAVHEVAMNAVTHGTGEATVRVWQNRDAIVCEVRNSGELASDPLLDRTHPSPQLHHGRGLWIANQLCDLVQLRAFPGEVVVRLHLLIE